LVAFGMERKLQAIRSDAKEVGFELVVGLLDLGARVGVSATGFTVLGAAVGSGVAGAFVIGAVVGGAPEIGEEIGADIGVAVIGSGVLGAAVVGTVVGDVKEEILAADCGRITSTTSTTTTPRDTHANKMLPNKIHRYTGRWYHFVLTYSASATIIVPFSCPSGTRWASTVYITFSVATRLLPCAPVYDPPAEYGTPSSCLDSSFVNCLVVSWEISGDPKVRLIAVLRNDRTGNAPGAMS
jgi:hypothetical protein